MRFTQQLLLLFTLLLLLLLLPGAQQAAPDFTMFYQHVYKHVFVSDVRLYEAWAELSCCCFFPRSLSLYLFHYFLDVAKLTAIVRQLRGKVAASAPPDS